MKRQCSTRLAEFRHEEARVKHEHVQRTNLCFKPGDKRLDGRERAKVKHAAVDARRRAAGAQAPQRVVQLLAAARRDDDVCAVRCELLGRLMAYARVTARHQRNLGCGVRR